MKPTKRIQHLTNKLIETANANIPGNWQFLLYEVNFDGTFNVVIQAILGGVSLTYGEEIGGPSFNAKEYTLVAIYSNSLIKPRTYSANAQNIPFMLFKKDNRKLLDVRRF